MFALFLFLFLVWIVVSLILLLRQHRASGEALLLVSLLPASMAILLSKQGHGNFSCGEGLILFLLIASACFLAIWGIGRLVQSAPPEVRPTASFLADVLKDLLPKLRKIMLRTRRFLGEHLILTSVLLGFLFLFVMAATQGGNDSPGAVLLAIVLFVSAIAFFVLGVIRWVYSLFRRAHAAGCPPIALLKDMLAERLPSREQARLAAHLELCSACQHRVEGLSAGHNSWPGMARKLSDRPPAPEPALRKVVARLKEDNEGETRDEPALAGDLPLGFLSPADKPGQLGRLERYDVLEEIGRGGMGVVLKAFDPSLHRVVAIKVLAPQLATSGVARKRFLREAKAAAAVTHDHIVTIHAVDEANGLPYLVMQYIAGMSLQDRLDKEGPLELPEILRIGMQTASGLAAAHGHGIVHRDIKPANILLEDGVQRVKITDFGLARAMDDASLTQSGFVAGSPLYMAPEQARGETLDHRADLFSLGSVLYTMCTGRPPFRAANTLAVLRRVSEDTPRAIRETNPEIPDWLATLIDKLMAKDPNERFASAGEVVEVLGQQLAQLQQGAWVPPPAAPSAPSPGLPTSVTICPSCGVSLHVPESMVGNLVHCAECGKPFQVEDTSEVMQVARPVQWPLQPQRRRWGVSGKLRRWMGVSVGCAILVLLPILLFMLYVLATQPPSRPATVASTTAPAMTPWGNARWLAAIEGLPPEATLFGGLDLQPFGSLTLEGEWIQTLLRLILPNDIAAEMTPENLGRIRIDGIGLGYYEGPNPKDARAIVHLKGLALDGRKRIVEYIRRTGGDKVQIEKINEGQPAGGTVRASSPELPFALGIVGDENAYLAASLAPDAKASQHRKLLEKVPSSISIPNGYNPPWVRTALAQIPGDACGVLLGEIPAELRKFLTDALKLRVCPRTFVLHARREGDGVGLSLTLNLDKAGDNTILRDDLDRWRSRGIDDLQTRLPALRKEPQALTSVRQTVQTMQWRTHSDGSVRTQVRISGSTWKAVRTLLKRVAEER